VKEGDEGEGIWLMGFVYLYETELKIPLQLFKWEGRGLRGRDDEGNVTNVQYKSNWNCHYESPLYNEYILIKNKIS
jgi:hypothetical protein